MRSWKAVAEWYLGLPAVQTGEGTRWEWAWQPPWPDNWPVALAGAVAAAFLMGSWWAYRRDAAMRSRGQVAMLWSLRLAAVALTLLLWSQPTLWIAKTGLPSVAVLLDASASMAFRDSAAAAGESTDQPPPRRWDQLAETLLKHDGRWLHRLSAGRPLRIYEFAGQAVSVGKPEASGPAAVDELITAIRQLQPDGDQTRPAEAVRQVLAELRGMPPAALVIFTDGIASDGEQDRLSMVADLVRRRSVPLFVVPVGHEAAGRDVQLQDIVMDDVAFRGDPVAVTGKVRTPGISERKVSIHIRRSGSDVPLSTVDVTPRADGQPVRFETTVTLTEPGEVDIEIATPVLPGEVDRTNNREQRHLSVREEKLRVLLVEAAPRYEFRYLKQWLERDVSVELQTLLMDADPEFVQEDRTALPYFPVQRDELWKYDVIVLGDVSLGQLGATAPEWIAEFVREKGGGLVLVSGPKANLRGWGGSPLEALLPVPAGALAALRPASDATEAFTPQLTLDGLKGAPMFRFADTESASQQIWGELPGLYGLMELPRLKPTVRVLAEHPFRRGERERLPVVTMQQIGAGKVLFHATDELWRWRFRQGDTYFGRYWGQAIRYLSRGKLLGHDRAAELMVDRQVYRRGDPVTVRVRFLDEQQTPTQGGVVRVMVEQTGGGRRELTLTALPYAPTVFEGQLSQLGEGPYHVWISRPAFSGPPPAVDFRIETAQRELQQRNVDRAELKAAAERAGGRLVPLAEADNIPDWVPSGAAVPVEYGLAVPLWQRFEPLLLLACLLAAEWLLRRRWQMV